MRKMLAIAGREYRATVRTKSFVISLVLMPVLMGGSVIFQMLLKDQGSTEEKRFAVIDRTAGGKVFPRLEAAARQWNEKQVADAGEGKHPEPPFLLERAPPEPDVLRQRFELSERVRKKELDGFLEIGANVFQPKNPEGSLPDSAALRYQSNNPISRKFSSWAETVVNAVVEETRIASAGLSRDVIKAVMQPLPLVSKDLAKRNRETGALQDGQDVNYVASFLIPFGLVILMFMVIMIGATPLMQGVVEEKTLRIAEMLLGSVKPFPLMMGKLIGTVGISLTLAGVYLGGAYWAGQHFGYGDYIPPDVLAWFVVYLILAVLMFGSLFIAIGAAASEIKETQTLMMPVMVMACIPMFCIANVIQDPDSTFSMAISFFPPATPMLMVARQAVPPGVAWWQPVCGALVVLATTFLCVYAAGRIFRVGILMQGKGARFSDMVKWVFRG